MQTNTLKDRLELLYLRWHNPQYLGTDPLVLVREAPAEDREVIGFLVSCLALGRASLVVKAGSELLARVGPSVTQRVREASPGYWERPLAGFGYRFFSPARVMALLDSVGQVLRDFGSLEAAWASTGLTGWPALEAFASIVRRSGVDHGILLPVEGSGGGAKRLNLFLRWMVRRDEIDCGTWSVLNPADLFMPVDTHILQWAHQEGLTQRRTADRQACFEITQRLRTLCPHDPLRYDFAITRAGMQNKGTLQGTQKFHLD